MVSRRTVRFWWVFFIVGTAIVSGPVWPKQVGGASPAQEAELPVEKSPSIPQGVEKVSGQEVVMPDDVCLALEDLNNAFASGSSRRIGRKFSMEAMFESLQERKLIPALEAAELSQLRERMEVAMRSKYRNFSELAWTHVKWTRFERLDDQRVVVLGRHYDANELSTSVRWWLKREADEWKVYDLEILDLNLRFSTLAGVGFSVAGKQLESMSAFQEISSAAEMLNSGMLDEADLEQLIENADLVLEDEFPDDIKRFALLLRAVALAQLDDATAALEDLEQLEKMPGESPILYRLRGEIFASQERHAAAIESFQKLGELLGYDVGIHEALSDIFLDWGKSEQAADQARLGLKDMPESVGCLASLAAALPASKVAELEPLFKDHDYDEYVLATVIEWCVEADRLAGAKFAYQILKKHHPNSDLVQEWGEDLDSVDD
jgi:tetratricopeptide (TPR) repeat protein